MPIHPFGSPHLHQEETQAMLGLAFVSSVILGPCPRLVAPAALPVLVAGRNRGGRIAYVSASSIASSVVSSRP